MATNVHNLSEPLQLIAGEYLTELAGLTFMVLHLEV